MAYKMSTKFCHSTLKRNGEYLVVLMNYIIYYFQTYLYRIFGVRV